MEYPLIDTGMGDMPTAVPSVIPQVSANPAEQFDAEAYKLLEGMNPVLLGHYENVARASNDKLREADVARAALGGTDPVSHTTNMVMANRKAKLDEYNKLLLDRAGMTQKEADPTAMNNAFDNVLGIMGNAPTAPQMQRPKLSDNEQLATLLAGAMGGGWEGAGQALGAAYQGAGVRANRENQIAQANFEAENNQWVNKLRVAQQQANNQSSLYNQAENRNQRNFSNELRLQDGRIAKTQQDIEDLDKEIQGFVEDTQKSISEYTRLKGEMTDDDMNHLMGMIDTREKAHGLPKGYIAERMTIAPVGWESATVRNQKAIAAGKEAQAKAVALSQSWKNAKALFDMRLKQVNMMGKVTEADRKALLPLAQELFPDSPESLLPQVGEDWRKLQGQQRLNKPTGTGSRGGSGGRGRGGSPKALDRNLGGDPPAISKKEANGKVARAVGAIKKLEAMIKAQGDPKKRAQMEIQLKGYQATRDYYASMANGEVKPFEPPPPNTDIKPYWDAVNQIVQSGKDLMGKGEKVGIPLGNSYAEGGDKTQYGTQNPPAQTKPAKSPQNAGNGQPPKGVVVTKSKTKFFDKKPTK